MITSIVVCTFVIAVLVPGYLEDKMRAVEEEYLRVPLHSCFLCFQMLLYFFLFPQRGDGKNAKIITVLFPPFLLAAALSNFSFRVVEWKE